jgi:sulfite reductase (NADPH) hemoprotein beta-component
MACVALPTCGLSLAESERYLPSLITELDEVIEECGLREDAIIVRMTGCPNGCARPYLGEIGFVGRAPGKYNIYLGAAFDGSRLNKLYKPSVQAEKIVEELAPIIRRYATEREEGERFGDFTIRAGYVKATTEGRMFHEEIMA